MLALARVAEGGRVVWVEPRRAVGGLLVDFLRTRYRAELLIDCEEDRTVRAVLVGMLRED